MHSSKDHNMPPGETLGPALPVRPAGGGHGATAAEIARGYSRVPNADNEPAYPPPKIWRDSGLI